MIGFITKHAGKLLRLPVAYLILHFFIPIIINLNAELIAKTWIELKTPLLSIVNWDAVFKTWCEWQTLTAAIIALLASIIGLAIAQHQEKEAAKREYTTAKAFLPEAFAELCRFYEKIEDYYFELFNHKKLNPSSQMAPLNASFPETYKLIFRSVIACAPEDERTLLIKLLCWLRIDISRLETAATVTGFPYGLLIDAATAHYYLYENIDWARGDKANLKKPSPSNEELRNILFQKYPQRVLLVNDSNFASDFNETFDKSENSLRSLS